MPTRHITIQPLTDPEVQIAEHAVAATQAALGAHQHHLGVVAEVVANLITPMIEAHCAIAGPASAEPIVFSFLADLMRRVDSQVLAKLAILNATNPAKKPRR